MIAYLLSPTFDGPRLWYFAVLNRGSGFGNHFRAYAPSRRAFYTHVVRADAISVARDDGRTYYTRYNERRGGVDVVRARKFRAARDRNRSGR